jgi:hypothetical protein
MSASGKLIQIPPQLQHEEDEIKLDKTWKKSLNDLHHLLEKMYFIGIYFNSLTTADKYQTGKYGELQQDCQATIKHIYEAIIPLLTTGKNPSQALKNPERVRDQIMVLLNDKLKQINIKPDTSRNSPDRILQKTLLFMSKSLSNVPADPVADGDAVTQSFCLFKGKEDRLSYTYFLKLSESFKNMAPSVFKHKAFKKACELTKETEFNPALFEIAEEKSVTMCHPDMTNISERRRDMQWRLQAGHHELEAHTGPLKAKLAHANTFIASKKEQPKPQAIRAVSFDPVVKTFRR